MCVCVCGGGLIFIYINIRMNKKCWFSSSESHHPSLLELVDLVDSFSLVIRRLSRKLGEPLLLGIEGDRDREKTELLLLLLL